MGGDRESHGAAETMQRPYATKIILDKKENIQILLKKFNLI